MLGKYHQDGSLQPPRQPITTATSPEHVGAFPGNSHTFLSGLQHWLCSRQVPRAVLERLGIPLMCFQELGKEGEKAGS